MYAAIFFVVIIIAEQEFIEKTALFCCHTNKHHHDTLLANVGQTLFLPLKEKKDYERGLGGGHYVS